MACRSETRSHDRRAAGGIVHDRSVGGSDAARFGATGVAAVCGRPEYERMLPDVLSHVRTEYGPVAGVSETGGHGYGRSAGGRAARAVRAHRNAAGGLAFGVVRAGRAGDGVPDCDRSVGGRIDDFRYRCG